MAPKASSNLRGQLLSIVLAALCISLADCKPLEAPKKFDAASEGRSDPLLAMPSEYSPSQGPHEVAYVAQPQVHYIVQHEPQAEPNQQQQAAELGAPHQEQPRQEVSYVLVKSESGAAQNQPDTPVEEDCNQREANEYVAAQGQSSEGRQEYPGEIVYVSQNGENRQAVEGQHQEPESLGSAMSQSSGLPATILTEIPVKDMPYEVLEKLRREYGVKVVATRDRPGANLVINCDDYTGHGQNICSRQAAAQSDGLYPTNLAASPVEEQPSGYLRRELASSILHTTSDALESPDAHYVTSDANSGATGEVAPQPDSQGYREGIGSKAYLALDQAEPTQPERHVETSSSLADTAAGEKSDVQPENETHDSGFEAQPVAGVHEAESRQVGKRVGSQ